MKWKPIDTAPKDGRLILVCQSSYYFPTAASWIRYNEYSDEGKLCWRNFMGVKLTPTHWMELPEPPDWINGKYVSVWDNGTTIYTKCEINRKTHEVRNIEIADVDGFDLDILVEEYVLLPSGNKVYDFLDEEIV